MAGGISPSCLSVNGVIAVLSNDTSTIEKQPPVDRSDFKHRLAAILAADVVGYSRLMAEDDRATVTALDAARAIFRLQIESHQGRVIDMAGDSVLAVFETALGAVSAAVSVQETLNSAAQQVPEDRRMLFRIGLHLGDVIEKPDGTIYGDGVNIAARLEGLAMPGGVTVSDAIQGAVRGKISKEFEDGGEQNIKNIPHPVQTFRMMIRGLDPSPAEVRVAAVVADNPKPTIAVLPFNVLSDDSHLGFFADGLAEDVIALLARVPGFLLISRSSSFVFRDRSESIEVIARQLGVRYIVEGSVRPAADRMRVTAQLTEAGSGRLLWSNRFESGRGDTGDLQDGIARGIMSELEPELTRAEIALIKRQRPENLDAWGFYHQAMGAMSQKGWSNEGMSEARAHFQRAFTIDPGFSLARAHFSLITAVASNVGILPHTPDMLREALDQAEQAILQDDGSTEVLGLAGCTLADLGERERGMDILERSIELDPSNAQAHVALGANLAMAGQREAGIEKMRYGMRISPRDRRLGFWGWALGNFMLRVDRTEEALLEARTAAVRDPRLHLVRIVEAVALLRLTRIDDARVALRSALRLRPVLTLGEVAHSHGRRVSEELEPLWNEVAAP